MPVIVKQKNYEDPNPIEGGTYHGVCIGVVDVGTQVSALYGAKRQIIITWELPEVLGEDSKPRLQTHWYNMTLHDGSRLFLDLSAWRGKDFTSEELAGFDVCNIIGANCFLSIGIKPNGKPDVKSVSKLTKTTPKVEPVRPTFCHSIDESGFNFDEKVPDWQANVALGSEEHKASALDNYEPEAFDDVPAEGIPF